MKVKAKKSGRFNKRFYDPGDVFEIEKEIFDQYRDALLTWVEPIEQ